MFKILLRPFAYLTIKHSDPISSWVNWVVPGFFGVFTALLWLYPCFVSMLGFVPPSSSVVVWGEKGLVSSILGFVQSLPGFYTAALAAVATFGGDEMRRVMPGIPPKMRFLVEGQLTAPLDLSRRLFLTSMFAYLTALSFILTIVAIVGTSVAQPIASMFIPAVVPYVAALAAGIYVMFFAQLLSVTGWGLYYLGERMHLTDGNGVGP